MSGGGGGESKRNNNITIAVMVDKRGWKDWGFSFFEAQQLELYGRHNYKVEWFDFTNDPQRLQRLASEKSSSSACLLVSNPKGLQEIRQEHAPHCKTWIINDEYCKQQGDIRHYFKQQPLSTSLSSPSNSNNEKELFVPLGPRYDFDRAFRERYHNGGTTMTTLEMRKILPSSAVATTASTTGMIKTSQRPLIFNAIFSKSTSPSRKELKDMLLNSPRYSSSASAAKNNDHSYFIQIPGKWRRQMHPVFHVNSSAYVEILSKSKFTLSPTGHNPECFRFYESIWMGSIPVMVVADSEYQTHKCPNALAPILESALRYHHHINTNTNTNTAKVDDKALLSQIQQVIEHPEDHFKLLQDNLPFVILNNWTLLESTLERIMNEGPEALDARQQRLQQWFVQFMQERVWKVEDYLLNNNNNKQ